MNLVVDMEVLEHPGQGRRMLEVFFNRHSTPIDTAGGAPNREIDLVLPEANRL